MAAQQHGLFQACRVSAVHSAAVGRRTRQLAAAAMSQLGGMHACFCGVGAIVVYGFS